ncbi:MAG: VOC family protein [Streptosporangiales bacterium]|nr:VOC family protein [Streptosporangiales bacterium]
MTILRLENVGIVVEDLKATIAFFVELGFELEGEMRVEESWAARISGFDEISLDVAMMKTPDGHACLELMRFHTPAAVHTEPANAPANALGIRRILFSVQDIDGMVAGLRARGVELVGELTQIEDSWRFAYVRGPEGIIVALAEQIG